MINILAILSGLVFEAEERDLKDLVEDDGHFDFKKYDSDFGKYPDSMLKRAKGKSFKGFLYFVVE